MQDRIAPNALRFERLLDASVEKVWRYLTEPDLRAQWFMAGPSDMRVGGTLGLTVNHERLSDRDVPTPERYRAYSGHSWKERITRFEPPFLLAFTWEDGEAGEVTFELSQQGAQTLLVLTHTGLRGSADAISFGGGWHSHLAALKSRIKGEGVPDFWALHENAEALIEEALR